MAKAATARGLRVLGFAEHAPLAPELDGWHMPRSEFPAYVAEVEEARARHSELEILLGLEVDYLPGVQGLVEEFCAQPCIDYVIGSVHYIDGWNFDSEEGRWEWDVRDRAAAYRRYYQLVRELARGGGFEIVGHLDLPKKFGYRMPPEVWDEVEQTLQVIRQEGLALELNTAGLRVEVGEAYPETRILRRAAELGIPLTLGTDAHDPQHVASDLDWAIRQLADVGCREVVYFRKRSPVVVPLQRMLA